MRVKIGSNTFDSNDIPIMIILSDIDKKNITNMHPEATKYCSFPDTCVDEDIEEWMNDSII